MGKLIYKILRPSEWAMVGSGGAVRAEVDVADGYVHLSTAEQLRSTLAKWFVGVADAMLLEFDAEILGDNLRWEPARGGDLFPHFYGDLSPFLILRRWPLALGPEGYPAPPPEVLGAPS